MRFTSRTTLALSALVICSLLSSGLIAQESELATEDEVRQHYDVVTIPSPTRLSSLASEAGVSVADLRTANTDLASNATVTPVRNFPLYVPRGGGETLVASLQATPRVSVTPPPPPPARTPPRGT